MEFLSKMQLGGSLGCDQGRTDYVLIYGLAEGPETKQENITLGVWCCSICTFDNEEGMSACNICGVLRTPLGNACSNGNKNTVDGMCKDSGASIMARSLFASLSCLTPNKPKTSQQRNDNFLMEECNSFWPLKFDVPSPYDLVLKGLRLSKVGSKEWATFRHQFPTPFLYFQCFNTSRLVSLLLAFTTDFGAVVACRATFIALLILVIGLIQIEYQNRHDSPFQTHSKSMGIFLIAICIYGLVALFQLAQLCLNYSRFFSHLVLISRLLSAMSLVSVFLQNRLYWLPYMIWLVFIVIVVGLVTWDLIFRHLSQWHYKKITTTMLNLFTSLEGLRLEEALGLDFEQELGRIINV
ncbi:hypothetical protein LOK49_Contig446G00002 [Camellia lanceoleosa]|nr:hypothetical protein LOK49_Contig446G00002 [Camellia lanceoleosa]